MHELYLKGVQSYLDGNSKLFSRLIKNPQLNQTEKTLLQVRVLLKERSWQQAIDLLLGLSQASGDFLLGEKHFLLGNAYSYLGQWRNSLDVNRIALEHFLKAQHRPKIFLSYYNLSVDHSRINNNEESLHLLMQARQFQDSQSQEVMVLRAEACVLDRQLQFAEALIKMEHALTLVEHLNQMDAQTLLLVASDIYFKNGEWDRSRALLKKCLKSKLHHHSPRVIFNDRLIDRIISSNFSSLGQAEPSVALSDEYHLKWKILSHIQSGEQDLAIIAWSKLRKMFPQTFADNFIILHDSDRRSPFGVYLQSFYASETKRFKTQNQAERMRLTGATQKLVEVLAQSRMPIRKEALIEEIWGQPYLPTFDAKFYKLVERAKKRGIHVKNVNQSYMLVA